MFRAELIKLTTVRSTKIAAGIGIGGLALTQLLMFWLLPALSSGLIAVPDDLGLPIIDIGSFAFQYASLNLVNGGTGAGSIGIALVAILSIGLLAATTDYRWGGMASAALAQPHRGRILAGKAAATAVAVAAVGIAYAIVCFLVLVASTSLSAAGLVVSLGDVLSTSVRGVMALVLLALCALAVGVLVRSQLAAFLIVIGFIMVEPIIQGLVALMQASAGWTQFLPLALAQTAAGDPAAMQGISPLIALGVLAVGTAAILLIAGVTLKRRDL